MLRLKTIQIQLNSHLNPPILNKEISPRPPSLAPPRRPVVGFRPFGRRLRGNGPDLQGLVDALRFRVEAPVKPSLTTRPLNQPPGQQRNWTGFFGFF